MTYPDTSGLPVNLDVSYVDDPANPGRKAHQQHHDLVHAAVKAVPVDFLSKTDATATYAPIDAVSASVYRTADLSVADVTATAVPWTAEKFDTAGFHDNATNPSRLSVPVGEDGLYLVTVNGEWAPNASGERVIHFQRSGAEYLLVNTIPGVATISLRPTATWVGRLAYPDYVECVVYQSSGAALNWRRSVASSDPLGFFTFSITKLGK